MEKNVSEFSLNKVVQRSEKLDQYDPIRNYTYDNPDFLGFMRSNHL